MNNHKSEYGVIQTIRFMIRQAVKEAPAVLVWLVVDAILALILQLLELYVTPVLLRDIEEQIALKELVTTILFFSACHFAKQSRKKLAQHLTVTLEKKIFRKRKSARTRQPTATAVQQRLYGYS